MKFSRKNIVTASLGVILAVAMFVGGGTFAYLQGMTDDTVNEFQTNKVMVELTETTGKDYNIIPGTTQAKDPKVTVNNTVDAYVYVKITDQTDGLVTYAIADGWTKLDGYDNVYYREVAKDAANKAFAVLKDNVVSYDAALENSDMMDEAGTLKDGVTLAFNASAIQKTPFDDPRDAYEEMIPANSTLAVSLTYSQESNPDSPKFVAETIETEDSTLFQTGALKAFYPSNQFYKGCQYTFTIKGSSDRDMALTFDFDEKCGENESYKGQPFAYGFGGLGDTFLLEGDYPDWSTGSPNGTFTLVGDYYPVVLTVAHTKGDKIDFEFTGSLTALATQLTSGPCVLTADTEYDEEFTITLNWPYQTAPTDDCYVLKDGVKDLADPEATVGYMDRADTIIGDSDIVTIPGKTGGELWANFEVVIKKAPKNG